MEIINLSPSEQIYKLVYNGPFTQEAFLKRFNQNKKISTIPNSDSVWIEFECDEFKSIDSLIFDTIKNQISNEDNHIKSDVSLNHIEDNETKFKDHSIICNINSSCDLEILSSVLNNQESLEKGLACQQFDEMEEKYIVYGGRRTPII